MASKAQMQMLLNMGKGNSQQSSTGGQAPPFQKKKKGNNLAGAARRKLAALNAAKKGGNKNSGIGHPVDTAAIDNKEAQLRAKNNGTN